MKSFAVDATEWRRSSLIKDRPEDRLSGGCGVAGEDAEGKGVVLARCMSGPPVLMRDRSRMSGCVGSAVDDAALIMTLECGRL